MKTKESFISEELSESGIPIGIESSSEENDEEQMEPFDPSEISIQQRVVPMDVIVRRLKQNTITLAPSFQRKEVWDNTRKSRLIESLMLNIPLPMFYVAADEMGKWEVVDGLQRLSTIRDFMIGNSEGRKMKLKSLEFLGDKYNNKTFDDIEQNVAEQKLVNSIYETEMRFTVINPGTPESVKRNIFKRINTGGMPLTAQEIRHALYEGISSNLLQRLVSSPSFRAIGKNINDSRMGGSELILRLISFMIFNREAYKPSMDTWLSNTMRVLNIFPCPNESDLQKIFNSSSFPKLKISSIEEIIDKFELSMKRAKALFGGHAFRKSLPSQRRKSPINKSLFEVWGNVLSDLPASVFNHLMENRVHFLKNYETLLTDTEFTNAISRHSASYRGVLHSQKAILELIHKSIGDK